MHEPLLRRAANPAPYRILGLVLKPYSIGHALLLEEESHTNLPMPVALAAAVWICANSWAENRRMRLSLWSNIKLDIWSWRCRRGRFDFKAEHEAFRRYVRDGSLHFPISEITIVGGELGGDPRPSGAPFLLSLQQFIMMKAGKSEEEAWDYPFGLAKMRMAVYYENEGSLAIKSEAEVIFDQAVAAERERAGKGGKKCQA